MNWLKNFVHKEIRSALVVQRERFICSHGRFHEKILPMRLIGKFSRKKMAVPRNILGQSITPPTVGLFNCLKPQASSFVF